MMKSDLLIDALMRDLRPIPAFALERKICGVIASGAAGGLALLALTIGVRPDLAHSILQSPFFLKAAYSLAIGGIAISLLVKLARPEDRSGSGFFLFAAPLFALSLIAASELSAFPVSDWRALIFGVSAGGCTLRVVLLSLPTFIGLVGVFRRFAPTRLRLAGAAIGAAAGAAGAFAYMFYCREAAAGFVLVWYSLAVLLLAVFGALAGPLLLRWR